MGIRSEQIAIASIASDRLVNLPVQVLSSITDLTLLNTQTVDFYQSPPATTTIILGLFIEVTIIDAVTSPPSIRLGISAGENDIFSEEFLTGVDTLGETWSRWAQLSYGRAATAGQIVKLGIVAGAAASLVVDAHLIGFNI